MAVEHLTKHHPEPDALQSVLEIDACLTQARAIVRLMGATSPDEAMPPDTRQNAAWAVSDLRDSKEEAQKLAEEYSQPGGDFEGSTVLVMSVGATQVGRA